MSKPNFGKLMEEAMANSREEQEQIGYEMLREGEHSVKEIAEAMGVTSLHEVNLLLEKYNDRRISQGKPPAVLAGSVKIPQSSTVPVVGPIISSAGDDQSRVDVMLNDDDRALVDRIALNALTIAVADCDDGIRAGQIWRKALTTIDTWLTSMLPEIRKVPDTVQPWAQIAAAIALAEVDADE